MALQAEAWSQWQASQADELDRVRKAYRRGARTVQAVEAAQGPENGQLDSPVTLTLDQKAQRFLGRQGR
ncbi:MAG: hypothetical protein V3T00_09790 [bacterium]